MMIHVKGPGVVEGHKGASLFPNFTASILLSISGTGLRVAIIHARWNDHIVNSLITGAKEELLAAGVQEEDIVIETVPGSYELSFAVQR